MMEVLDEVPYDDWEKWEYYWISQFKAWGFRLTNLSNGGYDNSYKRNDHTKSKMRKSRLGKKLSNDTKLNMSESGVKKHKEFPKYNIGEGNSKIILDRDNLYEKYIKENLSLNKCANYFGVSKKTIFTNITEYGFKKDKSNWKDQVISNPMKIVLQFDVNNNFIREWVGLKSINRELNINSSNIANCCRGLVKSAGGYIWKYKD